MSIKIDKIAKYTVITIITTVLMFFVWGVLFLFSSGTMYKSLHWAELQRIRQVWTSGETVELSQLASVLLCTWVYSWDLWYISLHVHAFPVKYSACRWSPLKRLLVNSLQSLQYLLRLFFSRYKVIPVFDLPYM